MLTKEEQKVLNKICRGLERQGGPCKKGGSCEYYRKSDGRRCAVGHALNLKEAKEIASGPAQGLWAGTLPLPERLRPLRSMLSLAQLAHDSLDDDADGKTAAAVVRAAVECARA